MAGAADSAGVQAGQASWFTGAELAEYYDAPNQELGMTGDRQLLSRGRAPWIYRVAGAHSYRAEVLAAEGDPRLAQAYRRRAYEVLHSRPAGWLGWVIAPAAAP